MYGLGKSIWEKWSICSGRGWNWPVYRLTFKMLNLHTILFRGLREPENFLEGNYEDKGLKQRIWWQYRRQMSRKTPDRKSEWGLYITITKAQSGRNGNKGTNIFKVLHVVLWLNRTWEKKVKDNQDSTISQEEQWYY